MSSTSNNNWTENKVKLLLKWRQHSRVYHWLHAKSSANKFWWYTLLFYMSAFFTVLGLGQNFSTFFTEGTDVFLGFQVADTMILAIIGSINLYLKTSKISELSERHSNTSKDFYSLQNEIEEQLTQSPEDRDDGKIYIKKIRVKLTALTRNSPEIIQSVWKNFTKAVENGEIFNESDPTIIYTNAESKIDDILYPMAHNLTPSAVPADDNIAIAIDTTLGTDEEKKEQRDFDKKLSKSGKIDPNILKALEYQMARFN